MRISARKCSKSAVKRLVFAFWEQEGVPNRKKVAKKSEFLFLQGADRPSGAGSAKDARRRSGLGFAKDAWSLVVARGQVLRKEEMSPAMARGGSCKITRSPAAAGETPAKISEEPSGGNGADYAQDARYRGDGDEASFCEKRISILSRLSRNCLLF